MGKRFGTSALAIAAVLFGPTTAPVSASSPTHALAAARKDKKAKSTEKVKLAITPKNGAQVRTHPVRVTVKAARRTTIKAAQLNGRNVLKDLRSVKPGVFRFEASPSHGLQYGRNRLKVRALAASGSMRTKTSTFRVTHTRPLSGAGHDRTVQAGSSIRLQATVKSYRGAKGTKIRKSWKVVQAPPRSALRKSRTSATTAALAGLQTTRSGGATMQTDVPGRYRIQLTAMQGGKSTRDTVTLLASDGPMVPVDTMATDQNQNVGIRVGDTFFPAPTTRGLDYLLAQVLVLDRATLAPVPGWNRTYGICGNKECYVGPGDTTVTPGYIEDMSFGSDKLVIVSVQPGFSGTSDGGVIRELGFLGGPKPPSSFVQDGQFSLIGVPGMRQGEADYHFYGGGRYYTGRHSRMSGYLIKNRWEDYQFVDPRRATFNTGVGRGCAATCSVEFAVNGQNYTTEFTGTAGFAVDVFDSFDLSRIDHDAFVTNGPDSTAEVQRMTTFLSSHFGPGAVVMINSVSQPGSKLIGSNSTGDAAKNLAAAVMNMGGTRHTFNTAAVTGQNYTAIGSGGSGEGSAEEAIGASPALQGQLTPDNAGVFRVSTTSDSLAADSTLQDILMSPPKTSAWPEQDNPAIAWIGNHTTPRLGPDPRSAYWTQTYDWASISNSIDDLKWDCPKGVTDPKRCVNAPGVTVNFSQEDFNRAQDTLSTEASWVSNVKNYMANFAAPYEKAATKDWEDTQTEAYTKFRAKPDPLQANPLDVLYALVDFFEPFAGDVEKYGAKLEKLLIVAATALDFGAMHLDAQEDGSSPDEELQVTADRLATTLRDQADATADSFDVMGNVIVSDHEKLATIGALAECNGDGQGANDCPAEYQWDDTAIKATAAAAQRSAQREIYTELIPVEFPVWTIRRSKYDDPINFYCYLGSVTPFDDVQKAARIAALQEIYPDGSRPSQYDTFTIADVYSRYSVTNLDDQSLKQLFSPAPDSLEVDNDTDGLGMNPQEYARGSRSDDWPNNAYGCGWP